MSPPAILDDDALVAAQRSLPLATPELPGTGGAPGTSPDDFEVEELPSFEPTGSGEHLYLWLEKRGVDSRTLFRHLARALEVDERDVGYAGLKDSAAVTRQYVSVPARAEPRLAAVETDRIRVLRATRGDSKLRAGHLDGNRFRMVLRGVDADAESRAQAVLVRLGEAGLPNYYGPQRFGREGDTLRRGLALLRGGARPSGGGFLLRLQLSAVQSALFNLHLADRIERGAMATVERGEVLQLRDMEGPFLALDAAAEQLRLARREVVPTGPMFGPKMRAPTGRPAERERELLARAGLSLDEFARFGKLLAGTRRPLLVWPHAAAARAVDGGVELRFELPAGSYATVLAREVTKAAGAPDVEGDES